MEKSNQHNLTMPLRQDKKKIVAPFQVCYEYPNITIWVQWQCDYSDNVTHW